MKNELKGVIHGKMIELEQAPDLPDGQQVAVTVEPVAASVSSRSAALEGLHRAAGAWADDPEDLERFLEWNRQQRKGSRSEIPE